MPKTAALILAAGMGTRMGGISKASLILDGVPVLLRTARSFQNSTLVDAIVIAVKKDELEWTKELMLKNGISKLIAVVCGKETRQLSAKAAFAVLPKKSYDFVAIHDGARCLITPSQIDKVIAKAHETGASAASYKVTDTLKTAENGIISSTVDRTKLYAVQTPQVFSYDLYQKASSSADLTDYTDDCGLCESIGAEISLVDIGKNNIKLTTREDIMLAHSMLSQGTLRVGHGYDAHRLKEGRKLIIGGCDIPYELGLDGHSDADVLLHAVMDALLGAAALGDIGKHFPPSDDSYKDISSIILLKKTAEILRENGYSVINIDATVVAQKPKLSPYIDSMRKNISEALEIDINSVSVKATTEERMGFTGALEGISSHCVCMICGN